MEFPILTLSRPSIIEVIKNENDLTICNAKALKNGYYANLRIVDTASYLYIVESAKKVGVIGPFAGFDIFLNQKIRVELLITQSPSKISLDELRKMVFDSFENWHGWSTRGDFDELKEKIENAKSVVEVIEYLKD
jgi:hypothetical protein